MSLDIWRATVEDEIAKLLNLEPTEQKAITLAALILLRDKWRRAEKTDAPTSVAGDMETGAPPDSFASMVDLADDELADADKYIQMGEDNIARDELRHAQHFLDKAKAEAFAKEDQTIVRDLMMRHDLMAQTIR